MARTVGGSVGRTTGFWRGAAAFAVAGPTATRTLRATMMRRFPLGGLVVAFLVILVGTLRPVRAAEPADDTELKFVLVVTRHGVRSPLPAQRTTLARYAAQPLPEWEVPPGHLTPHGKRQMTLMGEYYRARFVAEGLLSGDVARDTDRVYFRSDSDERTLATARGLGAALLPGVEIAVQARPNDGLDPLFLPVRVPLGKPDRQQAVASVLGRVGGDLNRAVQANQAAFATLQRILVGESGEVPAGRQPVLPATTTVTPGNADRLLSVGGPLYVGSAMTDVLMLEYGNGNPLERVGWGRATPERITQLMTLHSLYFELSQASSYPAQVQSSNLASHILASLEQAASGRADARAFGGPGHKVVIVVGHDTNIANLGGLLGLNWWLPGTQRNPLLPGGALVFELRERRADRQPVVRVSYVSQTLDQMRELTPLTLAQPPAIARIYVPAASGAGEHFDAPLPRFAARVRAAIDPQFVTADPN